MRVGNKKPAMTVNKTVSTGTDKSSNTSAHVATGNKTVTGGQSVHGMPLMSAAASKAKY
ncbi:hypothetical protein [Caudoviricetes sp.]|nr:hypothetical protein [Caudoviricetes sp.]